MHFWSRSAKFSVGLAIALGCALAQGPARAEVKLVAVGRIPGTASDRSGLTDRLADGTPHNRLGSHGSSIAYTGFGQRYVMASDRGPAEGTVPFRCRFHVID